MTQNQLMLCGRVCYPPTFKLSPSGIAHMKFVLEHCSNRKEVGHLRRVWCKIPVVVSGDVSKSHAENITVGSKLLIHGFICYHQSRSGLYQIVLHAEQIELIDSGE